MLNIQQNTKQQPNTVEVNYHQSPSIAQLPNNPSQPIPQQKQNLPQKIPITFLWFGKSVPEDYLISLSQLDYPIIFLKNPDLGRQFKRQILDIQKSDYYRLYYLYQHGGIYSDFDNTIDYNCLMNILEPYRNQNKLVFMTDQKHTRTKMKQMTTNLIFAPYAKMPILKKMLDSIDQTKPKIWGFAGMKFVATFQQPLQISMSRCVKHSYDWSWFDASNSILGKQNQAHPQYKKKLIKKSQIIKQKGNIETQLNMTNKILKDIQKDYKNRKQQNQRLKKQIINTYTYIKEQSPRIAQKFHKNFPLIKFNQQNKNTKQKMNNNNKQSLSSLSQQQQQQQLKFDYMGQKFVLRSRIRELQLINADLRFQKDIYDLQVKIGILIIFFILIVGLFMMRNKQNKQNRKFRRVGQIHQQQRDIEENM